jgi:RNA polymerase-binding transcription factor DksA
LKKDELNRYKKRLLDLRRRLTSDVNHLKDETLGDEASGDLSSMPFHMADLGTETYDKDFALGLIQNGSEELEAIDQALARIGKGTYGTCEECECAIPKARLQAIPHARHCVQCQARQERRLP